MISTGVQLKTFITSLNAEAAIDDTLLGTLVETARTILEEERPWMVLRKTDTSKTVTTGNTWQTAINLNTITDFSRFYAPEDDAPIKLFDGNNQVERYYLKALDMRLDYKDISNTAIFDENASTLYLNGNVAFPGTLWLHYIATSPEIDLDSNDPVWTLFPRRFLPILGFYAVGIYKGAVDYDDINKLMLPENRETLRALKHAMEKWDNERQHASLVSNDPNDIHGAWRSGAVNRYDDY
jgi:hypothetical protein